MSALGHCVAAIHATFVSGQSPNAVPANMELEFLKYASKFPSLSDEDAQAIAPHIAIETFKKGTILLSEGEVSKLCYFVLQGCIRQYTVIEGEEKTTAFFTEMQAAVSFSSFSQQVPCNHYFACVEETTAIVGGPQDEQEMYQKFPKLATLTRSIMEQDFGKAQVDFATFMTSTPEERYRQLLATRPDLLQRAPQHQIASYLGVTPESLSRIRKRIAEKR
jgi:CRP-like cAMP-binding protein